MKTIKRLNRVLNPRLLPANTADILTYGDEDVVELTATFSQLDAEQRQTTGCSSSSSTTTGTSIWRKCAPRSSSNTRNSFLTLPSWQRFAWSYLLNLFLVKELFRYRIQWCLQNVTTCLYRPWTKNADSLWKQKYRFQCRATDWSCYSTLYYSCQEKKSDTITNMHTNSLSDVKKTHVVVTI